MFDIVSFGSALIDVFVNTNMRDTKQKICYPLGSKILIKKLQFDIGGGGVNTSVAFSRLGLKTGFVGKIGDDDSGKRILNLLKKEKVIFLGKIEKGRTSGYSIILDSVSHERTILTYKGINNDLKINEIPKFQTKWLYLSSSSGKTLESQKIISKKLHAKGTKICFNPSEYMIKNENIKDILNISEILILNKEEAQLLLKKYKNKQKNLLESLHLLGPKIVVVTDGKNPVHAFDGIKNYSIKPPNVKVVEKTGAGDAFASGFIAGQIIGKNINESLRLGLRESLSVISHIGSKHSLLRIKLK